MIGSTSLAVRECSFDRNLRAMMRTCKTLAASGSHARAAAAASGCKALALSCCSSLASFCIVGLPPSELTIHKMILTQCAVCATELGLSLGKKCGRCSTRYCGAECRCSTGKGRPR